MPIYDLGLEHVALSFAAKTIFTDVTQGIFEGDRIGIVGRNGDGKSTLLHLLKGTQEPEQGRVTMRNGLTFGMLDQRDPLKDEDTVRKAALENRQDYEWAADPRSREIVESLLGGMELEAKVGTLSGGQRRRVDLARLLLRDWDILALDEPTNHLDLLTIHWLAEHLKNRWAKNSGALLLVTHDRWFLDEVCTSMWEVHDGTIDPFEGGYSAYMLQRVERERQADLAETKRRNLARKELAWLTRGARARSTKQKFHVKAAQELIADVPPMRNSLELKRMATSRLGKQVVDLVDVTKIYPRTDSDTDGNKNDRVPSPHAERPLMGSVTVAANPGKDRPGTAAADTLTISGRKVLDDVTWLIGPGDRFGIVGANGAGKSTLLGLIDGSVSPTAGHVKVGKTVRFAVLTQRLDELEKLGRYRIKEVLSRYKPTYLVEGKEVSPSQLMERLGFESSQLMTRISDLSGGQKRRMQLLLILLDEPNVLIMDEPGNDLDTDMLAVMEDMLDSWPGTLIVVSHDRYLLERVTDQQFALINGKVVHLPGGVQDYLDMVESADRNATDAPGQASAKEAGNSNQAKAERVAKRNLSKQASAIERKLAKLADQRKDLERQMAEHDPGDYQGLNELNSKLKDLTGQSDQLEEEWLTIGEELE
ncbi:ABC-F family ATP-binding cassette domain-containing protein [Bifidobacterium sp. W8101]|uniref:ATP-binding cassette domain-containing protein n=1 Tax=Bifidobacterium TaxID=1678 RepID=UPI0018DE083D|nr:MULTISPECIES: ATP-binding cassette domain-containing protein [Bifidobacterium]MBI0125909.1 ABC-F family ATP-binding cassette domain-containing protein [Bifidobacterium choladohabitans]MBI0127478.1 ABC-F family ATP-binding cassette domain-containing protein [Bifidobacterium sp. W8103]MBI0138066.1 ABC-F family ATP-binding cassette domain-containing protein [Bifidobacterium sp. W8105]MBI0148963.1 ABC-F family ATP-binding cassette domain-containing protein [Bifidobacterium sp. W8107]